MNCGPKNGKKRYTRPVLMQMALSAGISNSVIRKSDIPELCRLLNLPAIAGDPAVAPIPIPAVPIIPQETQMLCGPTHGKNRYTKPVLAQMARRAGIKNSVIRKASLKDLCDLLRLSGGPAVIRPGSPGVPVAASIPQSTNLLCGPKHGPNRYKRPVLEKMARDAGIANSVIRKADLLELCRLLNLSAASPVHISPRMSPPTHISPRMSPQAHISPRMSPPTHISSRMSPPTNISPRMSPPSRSPLLAEASSRSPSAHDQNKLLFVRDIVDQIGSGVFNSKNFMYINEDEKDRRRMWWERQNRNLIVEALMRYVVEIHNVGFNFNYIDFHDISINGQLGPIYIVTSNKKNYDPTENSVGAPYKRLIVEITDRAMADILPDGSDKYLTFFIELPYPVGRPSNKDSPPQTVLRTSPTALPPLRSSGPQSGPVSKIRLPGTLSVHPECISRSKLHPKDYQLKVINHLDRNRGILVVHGLGSGKTLTSVIASQCYLDNNPRKNVYVITPKTLMDNWKNELVSGYKNVKNLNRYHFYTIPGFSNVKIDCSNSMLIIDEAHTLRTVIEKTKGKRASAVVECAMRCDKVILLTGTPYVNETNDLNNLISIIDGKTPENKKIFRKLYKQDDFFRQTFRNKISLYNPPGEIIAAHYPRVEKHEIVLPMKKKILKQYMEIEDKVPGPANEAKSMAFFSGVRIASNKADSKKPSNTLLKLFRISQKIEWLNTFIDSNMIGKKNENNKIVIFSSFIDSGMNLVEKLLELKDQKYSYINGESKKDDRAIVVKNYNKNKSRYLLISRAAGEGIDLKNTTFMIILDPAWNSVTTSQAMGRVARFNSHAGNPNKKVDIYMLYLLKPKEKLTHVKDLESFLDEYTLQHATPEMPEPVPSIDLYLRAMSISKQNNIDDFIKRVTPLTIENS